MTEATLRRGYTYGPSYGATAAATAPNPRDSRISARADHPRMDFRDPSIDNTRSSMQSFSRGDNGAKPYGSPDRKSQSMSSDSMRGSTNNSNPTNVPQCGIGILLIPDKNGQLTVVGMNPVSNNLRV